MNDETKIERALARADEECEGANYHGMVGLAQRVFDATEDMVMSEKRPLLAKSIAKAIIDSL